MLEKTRGENLWRPCRLEKYYPLEPRGILPNKKSDKNKDWGGGGGGF